MNGLATEGIRVMWSKHPHEVDVAGMSFSETHITDSIKEAQRIFSEKINDPETQVAIITLTTRVDQDRSAYHLEVVLAKFQRHVPQIESSRCQSTGMEDRARTKRREGYFKTFPVLQTIVTDDLCDALLSKLRQHAGKDDYPMVRAAYRDASKKRVDDLDHYHELLVNAKRSREDDADGIEDEPAAKRNCDLHE